MCIPKTIDEIAVYLWHLPHTDFIAMLVLFQLNVLVQLLLERENTNFILR